MIRTAYLIYEMCCFLFLPNGVCDKKTENRYQRTEDRRQKTENRKQKSEIRNQKSDIEAVGGHLLEGE